METSKISTALSDHLKQIGTDTPVEVILELLAQPVSANASLSRHEKIATIKTSFQQDSAPVERLIKEQGGELIDRTWINQTLRVRTSANCVEKLAELAEVSTIDMPNPLMAD